MSEAFMGGGAGGAKFSKGVFTQTGGTPYQSFTISGQKFRPEVITLQFRLLTTGGITQNYTVSAFYDSKTGKSVTIVGVNGSNAYIMTDNIITINADGFTATTNINYQFMNNYGMFDPYPQISEILWTMSAD